MRVVFFSLVALIFSSFNANCQVSVDVVIKGIKNEKGNIMFQLLDEKEVTVSQELGKPLKTGTRFVVSDLKPGKYAVRYYHDENMNRELDKNFLGKPVEGYGFSNNVIDTFGPPPFKDWLFELKENKKLELNITY